MGLISLVLVLAIVGFIVWLIVAYIPMPPPFKIVIYVIVAVVLLLFLMRVLGVADIPVPRIR